MREIKFRAWFGAENRWLCGYHAGGEGCHILGETIGLAGGFVGEVGIGEELNTVIAEQFTGLHDKNGKEIYENDIIDGLVVTYCANSKDGLGMQAGWYIQRGDFESWAPLESKCNENGDNWIVEGNIHENPELVKA